MDGGNRPLVGRLTSSDSLVEFRLELIRLLAGSRLQIADRQSSRGDLLGDFFITAAVVLSLLFERRELIAQLADLALGVGQLLGSVVARRARLRLDGVDLLAGQGELLDELLVLGAILFKLLAQRGDFGVAAAGEMLLDPFGGRLELLSQLAHAVAQLGLDLGETLAMIAKSLVRAFAQGAQLLCGYLCTVTRKTGARFGFFHDDAWPNVAISMESVCVVAQRDFGRSPGSAK
ncbi:MAG: hypothetical protein C0485_11165 [Pirellula sp.]|nr:hypothetical protein [Pirellula sp.]